MTMREKPGRPVPKAEPIEFGISPEELDLYFERSFKRHEEALRRLAKL
jgi:hypothetical protein